VRTVPSCAGAYVSGAAGSNECPAGSVRIETEAACRTAATAAGRTESPYQAFVARYSIEPRGCYTVTSNSFAFFNTHPSGAGNIRCLLLCAAVTTGAPRPALSRVCVRGYALACAAAFVAARVCDAFARARLCARLCSLFAGYAARQQRWGGAVFARAVGVRVRRVGPEYSWVLAGGMWFHGDRLYQSPRTDTHILSALVRGVAHGGAGQRRTGRGLCWGVCMGMAHKGT
jgi:hypothetical protein